MAATPGRLPSTKAYDRPAETHSARPSAQCMAREVPLGLFCFMITQHKPCISMLKPTACNRCWHVQGQQGSKLPTQSQDSKPTLMRCKREIADLLLSRSGGGANSKGSMLWSTGSCSCRHLAMLSDLCKTQRKTHQFKPGLMYKSTDRAA